MDWDDCQDRNQRMSLAKKTIENKYSCSWDDLYPETSAHRLVKSTSKFAQLFEEAAE